jgi:pyruvate dehydrogenase E2 component (dihydrolipoamide acetyltransferase)
MATKVIMPQGGQDIEKGTVVRWLKREGEPVKKGEVIFEVETEKAVFDVEAPVDGYLLKILVLEGVETPIFSTIGLIGNRDEVLEVPETAPAARPETDTAAVPESKLEGIAGEEGARPGEEKIKITPKAKRIAIEKGVRIQLLKGTGPQERITEKDVLDYLERQPVPEPAPFSRVEGGRVVPLSKVRKVTARRMQQSKQSVPHFYVTVSADMTAALKFRAKYLVLSTVEVNESQDVAGESALSVTDLITRASVLALREFPQLNSSILDEDHLVLWEDINIGIAVALEEGLVVPVLENADRLSLPQIALQSRRLERLAKEGKQSSLAQGRFTISNLGMFNVDNFIAIINPPEAAILAVGSIEKQVIPTENGDIGVRDRMNMTLSIDHRIGDGVLAARFLNKVKALLEDPECLA